MKKWQWGVLSLVFIALIILEVFQATAGQPVDWLELFAYLVFSLALGFSVDMWLKTIQKHEQATQLLESKHKLSLALATYAEWSELAAELARFPAEVAPVDQSSLLLSNPISQQFESVASWRASDEIVQDTFVEKICADCMDTDPGDKPGLKHYSAQEESTKATQRDYYYLPVQHRGSLIAFIQFRLKTGATLSDTERGIFENINNELAMALTAGQDRSRLAEMRSVGAALAEQHAATNLLNTSLNQHIGHLRSKLDHLNNNSNLQLEEIRAELSNLRETANALHETVHGNSKSAHPDTPQLNGLLHEQARKVAQRAGFILTFKSEGRQLPIKTEIQNVVLDVFLDTFKNIEKHAKATKVSVFVGWAFDILTVSITDNGVGFNIPGNISGKHLGFERMNERITALDGQIDLRSTAGEGTTVTFIIPNLSERLRARP